MGQTAAKHTLDTLKEAVPELKDVIPELQDVTLKGVVSLSEELGHGAYGSVFKVKHGGVPCAAKMIHPILIENVSSEERERIKYDFIRECLCCSSIRHPKIVQFLGVYYHSGQSSLPIMVMELMDTSLTSFVENNKSQIAIQTKMSILYDVSQGLSFLHNHKPQILHRDLSPNNVMLTRCQITAKIGDLGVAKVVRADNQQTKSKLTTAPGTLHFMPPEALDEVNPLYGTPIDVFSFGGIALHVFSEEWPTPSSQKMIDPVTEELVALSEAKRRQKYIDKLTSKAAMLKEIIEMCLNDNPKKRPEIQEVSEFFEPLKGSPSFAEAIKSNVHHIKWTSCSNLPCKLYSASVAVSAAGDAVYVTAGDAPDDNAQYNIFCYNTNTNHWDVLPEPGHHCGVLQMLDDSLNIFGGNDPYAKKVTTYNIHDKRWHNCYPHMMNKRFKPGVITYHKYVIVMGGQSSPDTIQDTIEVMDYRDELQWREISIKLPHPMRAIKPTISGETVVIVGYSTTGGRYTRHYWIGVEEIILSLDKPPSTDAVSTQWKEFSPATHWDTATVPYSNPPVIIGGSIEGVSTSDVKLYDASKNSWIKVDSLTSARSSAGVALVKNNTIIVIGGTSGGVDIEGTLASSLAIVEIGSIVVNN